MEDEDPLIKALKAFKKALLTKYQTVARANKSETEKPLTKQQHKVIKTCLEKIVIRSEFNKNDDILILMTFLELTGVIIQLTTKFFLETCMRHKSERRAFLLKGELSHYQISVKAF